MPKKGSAVLDAAIHEGKGEGQKPISFLIQGPTGGGKSFSLATLVEKYGPGIYHNLDRHGDAALEAGCRLYNTSMDDVRVFSYGSSISDETAFQAFVHNHDQLRKEYEEKDEPVGWLAVDSLSSMSLMAMNNVLDDQKRLGQVPYQQDYLTQMVNLEYTILSLVGFPVKHAIVLIAHTEYERDETTGVMMPKIAVTGKLSQRLLRFFQEIYYTSREGSGEDADWFWTTRQSRNIIARTQLDLEEKVPQDFRLVLGDR